MYYTYDTYDMLVHMVISTAKNKKARAANMSHTKFEAK